LHLEAGQHKTVVLLSDITNNRLLPHEGPHLWAASTTPAKFFKLMCTSCIFVQWLNQG